MATTAPHWSVKHHVHPGRFTNTCQVYTDPELKQTLAMSCEAYITLVRAAIDYIPEAPDCDWTTTSEPISITPYTAQ